MKSYTSQAERRLFWVWPTVMRVTSEPLVQKSHSFQQLPTLFYLSFCISTFPRLLEFIVYDFSFPTGYLSYSPASDLCKLVLFLISDCVYCGENIFLLLLLPGGLHFNLLYHSLVITSGVAAILSVYRADFY